MRIERINRARGHVRTPRRSFLAALVATQLVAAPFALAISGTWTLNGSDNWSDTTSWLNGVVADNNTDGVDSTADFSQVDLTADATVTLDSDRTLTNLVFGNTDATPAASWDLTGGTLTLNSSGSATPTITVNDLGTGILTVDTALAGTEGFTKAGPGMMVVTNASSSLSGPITVTGGVLSLGPTGSPSKGSGVPAFGTGQTITLSGGGYQMGGNQPSPNAYSNPLALTAGGTGTIATTATANNYTSTITGPADATLTVIGNTSGQAFAFNQNSQQLSGFLGTLAIADGNAIAFRSTSTISNGGKNTTFDLQGLGSDAGNSGNLYTRNPATVYLGALESTGTDGLITGPSSTNGTATYVIGDKGIDTTYGGGITDNPATSSRKAAVTKSGAGTLTLTGSNLTYTGATNINQGVLQIDGSLSGGGAVTVNTGGTLAGSGSITAGTTTVATGGHLDPGTTSSVGTITLNNLTLNGGTIDTEFNATANDSVVVSGTLTIGSSGAGFNFYNEGTTDPFATDGTYNLIQYGTLSGSLTSLTVLNTQAGKNYAFATDGTYVSVNISAGAAAVYWNLATGGTWNSADSWTAGGPPNVAGANASFGGGGTAITGPATVTLDGNQTVGTLSFASPNSFTIAQGAGGGTLTLDNMGATANLTDSQGSHTISAPVAVTDFGVNVNIVNAGDSLTISGGLSGDGTITTLGAGTLVLPTANPLYTGTVSATAGALTLGDANALSAGGLGAGGAINFAAGIGTFNLGTLSGGGAITLADIAAQPVALNVSGSSNTTYSGQLSGPGSLVRSGTGTLTLSGSNSYTGGTVIDSGTIKIGSNANAFGGSTGSLTMNGGMLSMNNASLSTPLNVPDGATATIQFGNNGDVLAGAITGSGTILISNTGAAGTVEPQLDADNTGFTGTINVTNGSEVRFKTDTSAGQNVNWVLSGTNGTVGSTIGISSTGSITVSLGALTGDATSVVYGYKGGSGASAQTYSIGSLNTDTTFAGTIMDGTGSSSSTNKTNINKEGTGTLTLTGTNTNTGVFTIDSGTIVVGDGATSGSLADGSSVSVSDTGTLIFNRSDNVTYAGAITIPSTASGLGSVEQNGSGTLTLSNVNSLVPQLFINSGKVALGANLVAVDAYLADGTSLDIGSSELQLFDVSQQDMVKSAIAAAYDNGHWDKAGILTSAGAANGIATLGYGVDSNGLLDVRYTLPGDLDLNGTVDSTDYSMMLAGNGTSWAQGDLNYDGVINADDWALFAVGSAIGNISNLAPVPEPAAVALLPLMMLPLGRRRRR